MDIDKVLNESLDGLWNNKGHGGASELPRKDYQPYSTSNGYTFPYQAGSPPVFPPTAPDPQNTPSVPWPLITTDTDLADAYMYIVSAVKKMKRCVDENPSLNLQQKIALKKLIKLSKQALKRVSFVGKHVMSIANLAGNLPPQSPNNTIDAILANNQAPRNTP